MNCIVVVWWILHLLLLPLKCSEHCPKLGVSTIGNSFTYRCFVRPYKNITFIDSVRWMKNGEPLKSNHRMKVYSRYCMLSIHESYFSDGGLYVCRDARTNRTLLHFSLRVEESSYDNAAGVEIARQKYMEYKQAQMQINKMGSTTDDADNWQVVVAATMSAILLLVLLLLLGIFYWRRRRNAAPSSPNEVVYFERANPNHYVETRNLVPCNRLSNVAEVEEEEEVAPFEPFVQPVIGEDARQLTEYSSLLLVARGNVDCSDNYVNVNQSSIVHLPD